MVLIASVLSHCITFTYYILTTGGGVYLILSTVTLSAPLTQKCDYYTERHHRYNNATVHNSPFTTLTGEITLKNTKYVMANK